MVTAKEYLNRLIILNKAIQHKEQRLKTLRDMVQSTSANQDSEAVQQTKVITAFENVIVKIIDLENEIKNDKVTLSEMKADIWNMLAELNDVRHQRILWLHYAESKTWSEVAQNVSMTKRHALRLQSDALTSLEKIFEKNKMSPLCHLDVTI